MVEKKTKNITEFFNNKELKVITDLLNENKKTELRKFLNSKSKRLKKKGLLPDYLYYYLLHTFQKGFYCPNCNSGYTYANKTHIICRKCGYRSKRK